MILAMNDMVTFSSLGKYRYGHWVLFIYNVG